MFLQVLLATLLITGCHAVVQQLIPSVQSFTPGNENSSFLVNSDIRIFVNSSHSTVGSPSLRQFAETLKNDLSEILGFEVGNVEVTSTYPSSTSPFVFLSLGSNTSYKYYSGVTSLEGYDFEITKSSYAIRASSPIGVWWGTRTLLQQIALAGSSRPIALSSGSGSDSPGWEIRGFMLDAGRHWFETSFLADLCKYASFFKIQSLHLHASDNLWNPSFLYGEDWRKLYSAFRFQPALNSPIAGLVPLRNESWSRSEFEELQSMCNNYGIDIVPEIDTPGHSLVITKWKPELMIAGAPDHLNLSYPETIPTIKTIWNEVLSWFNSGEVSIGADEYDASLADDYISFVNEMASYISTTSGKTIRVWGTREPSKRLSISKNVTIQHWDFPGDTIPIQLLQQGYKIINSEQAFLYLDGKTSDGGQFPVELDQDLMWSGAPGGKGWAPNIFSRTDPSNNTSPQDPHLRGSIMALWNDWGNNATTPLEIYYQLSRSLAVFSEKTWAGSGIRRTELTRERFDQAHPILNAAAPGQNLNRVVKPTNHNIVYHYPTVSKFPWRTSFESVGPPYTLKFSVKPTSEDGILFSGKDSRLHLRSLALEDTTTHVFYSLNVTLPSNRFTAVEILATREYTQAVIGGRTYWWTTNLDIWGEYMKVANMSFAAPSWEIGGGGFMGQIRDVSLSLGL